MTTNAVMTIIPNEVRIKNNNLPLGKFAMSPRFVRKSGRLSDTRFFIELSVEVTSTEEHRFPIDLFVSMTAIFDLSKMQEPEREEYMKEEALRVVFPYLRSMVTNVTSGALLPPIILPIIDLKETFGEG